LAVFLVAVVIVTRSFFFLGRKPAKMDHSPASVSTKPRIALSKMEQNQSSPIPLGQAGPIFAENDVSVRSIEMW
jgi:hypothetical protein